MRKEDRVFSLKARRFEVDLNVFLERPRYVSEIYEKVDPIGLVVLGSFVLISEFTLSTSNGKLLCQ